MCIQICLDKKTNDFCQGRFVSKLFHIFKSNNLVPQTIAQRCISVLRDSGWICGILGIRRFRQPTARCGIHAFSFEVDRAPCERMRCTPTQIMSCLFIHVCKHIHGYTHTHACIRACIQVFICIHIHVYTCVHTCIHTCIHMYTYTYMPT